MRLTRQEQHTLHSLQTGDYTPDPKAPYTSLDLVNDLSRMRNAWSIYQIRRDRDAVYIYLRRVFSVVRKWFRVGGRWAKTALFFQGKNHPEITDPFAIAIYCSADPKVVDRRTRSKWSRALRFVAQTKPKGKTLAEFMQSRGGINACADAYGRVATVPKR